MVGPLRHLQRCSTSLRATRAEPPSRLHEILALRLLKGILPCRSYRTWLLHFLQAPQPACAQSGSFITLQARRSTLSIRNTKLSSRSKVNSTTSSQEVTLPPQTGVFRRACAVSSPPAMRLPSDREEQPLTHGLSIEHHRCLIL